MDRRSPGAAELTAMRVLAVISSKGGVGKTTVAANLGGLLADAGLRVLLLDLDSQPTLSSYYGLSQQAPGGSYELIAHNQTAQAQVISHTAVAGLDLILSNDPLGHLNTLLLHAPDGRLRLRGLLPAFRPDYDLLLIDTQGARSVTLEMAILAADLALAPVTPELLAAREFQRGTLQVLEELQPFRQLGVAPPPLRLLLNRTDAVSTDARLITQALRQGYAQDPRVRVLVSAIPGRVAYRQAASLGLPAHRLAPRRPTGRSGPSCFDSLQALALELFPEWRPALRRLRPGQEP